MKRKKLYKRKVFPMSTHSVVIVIPKPIITELELEVDDRLFVTFDSEKEIILISKKEDFMNEQEK